MSILPAAPDIFPDDLWEEVARDVVPARRWVCLHTRSRQEKALARDLRGAEVPFYLPQVAHERRTPSGRKIRSIQPLFTGYLFLFGADMAWLHVLKGNRVANILEVVEQETLTRELRQIHRLLNSGLSIAPEPSVPVGGRVRVPNGPLAGRLGTVVRRGMQDPVVAVVTLRGLGAAVTREDGQGEGLAS